MIRPSAAAPSPATGLAPAARLSALAMPTAYSVLKREPWFSGLPLEFQLRLIDCSITRTLPAGRTLFRQGDAACGLFCLLQGAVVIRTGTNIGVDGLVDYCGAPAWLGESGFLDGLPRTHTVEAIEASVVLHTPLAILRQLLHQQPGWWEHMGRLMSMRLRVLFAMLDDMAQAPARLRVIRRILLLAEQASVQQSQKPVVRIQQGHLAQMLGLSRQSLNPILRQLVEEGAISVSYARLTVLDITRLRQIAHPDIANFGALR